MTYPDSNRSSPISPARLAALSQDLLGRVKKEAGTACDPPSNLFVSLLSSLDKDLILCRNHTTVPQGTKESAFSLGHDFARLVRGVGLDCGQAIMAASHVHTVLDLEWQEKEVSVGSLWPTVCDSYFECFGRGVVFESVRLETVFFRRKLREANRFILQERRRYSSIFKRMAEPALIVDQDLRVVETNKAFDRFFMVAGRDHIGEDCYLVLGDEFRLSCDLLDVLHGKEGAQDIEVDITIQGEFRSIIVNGTFLGDINREAVGGIVIMQDITARREAERVLYERERHYRSLIETMPDVTWRADKDGDFVYVSPNSFRIYGYSAEKMQQDAAVRWRAIHHDDIDLVRNAYCRFFDASLPDGEALRRSFHQRIHDFVEGGDAQTRGYDVTFRFQRADGVWVWIHERANHVEQEDGRWYANGVSSDVTALKMAEAELERHHFRLAELVDERTSELLSVNQKLKQEVKVRRQTEQALVELTARLSTSNQELDQFAHVASHELKEPLMLIRAFSERLGNKYAHCFNDKGKEYLSRINAAAEHMRQLVDGFLALSQVTSGGQSYEEIDLNDLVQEVIQDLETRVTQSNALFDIGNLGRIGGDRVQIRQLFQNIFANSLKYSKPGAPPKVVLRGELAEDQLFYEILIQDNGIGFDLKDAERIFKPLERLHSRREYEGTGMGLTTCQKIVARHGGEIVARGVLGQGATFIIRLPAGLIYKS